MHRTYSRLIPILSLVVFDLSFLQCPTEAAVGDVPQTLVGADLKQEDAAVKCDVICVGTIVALGNAELGAAGGYTYRAQIRMVEVFKGKLESKTTILIHVRKRKGIINELRPEAGGEYIFFLKKYDTGPMKALKLLPATDENIAKVKASLIGASSTN